MTTPIDISDPKLAKALAHPLRLRILGVLENRVASPREIATELGTPLPNTSYHVRQLASLGLVELVRRKARGSAVEHYYTTKFQPTVTDEGWARLPEVVKRAYIGGSLANGIAHMTAAADQGGFDREDIHYSRTTGRLDAKAWRQISSELLRLLKRVERIVQESETRAADDPGTEAELATVIMMLFGGPEPAGGPARATTPRGAGTRARASRGTARRPAS